MAWLAQSNQYNLLTAIASLVFKAETGSYISAVTITGRVPDMWGGGAGGGTLLTYSFHPTSFFVGPTTSSSVDRPVRPGRAQALSLPDDGKQIVHAHLFTPFKQGLPEQTDLSPPVKVAQVSTLTTRKPRHTSVYGLQSQPAFQSILAVDVRVFQHTSSDPSHNVKCSQHWSNVGFSLPYFSRDNKPFLTTTQNKPSNTTLMLENH